MLTNEDIENMRVAFANCAIAIEQNTIKFSVYPAPDGNNFEFMFPTKTAAPEYFVELLKKSVSMKMKLRPKIGVDVIFEFSQPITDSPQTFFPKKKPKPPVQEEKHTLKRPIYPEEVEIFMNIDWSDKQDILRGASEWLTFLAERRANGAYHLPTSPKWVQKKEAMEKLEKYLYDCKTEKGPPDKYDGGDGYVAVVYETSRFKTITYCDARPEEKRALLDLLSIGSFSFEAGLVDNEVIWTLVA